ncbi:MAG: hemN [Elusimicrobia bacterium]|nr:MAG: hemN [Elusimicrobiota bacterium]KAF0155349.1 MAG: hemN [Elusimicrobiota bacterium]
MPAISDALLVRALEAAERGDPTTAHCSYPPFAAWGRAGAAFATGSWRAALSAGEPFGIYVHFPYCQALCPFCRAIPKFRHRPGDTEAFLAGLERECRLWAPVFRGRRPVSLFLGGGTPNLLKPLELGRMMRTLREVFRPAPGAQIVAEALPEYLDAPRIGALIEGGVTGLSIGLQSLDPMMKVWAGRRVTAAAAAAALRRCGKEGVRHILVDLLAGLPGQSEKSFLSDVRTAAGWRPDEIVLGNFSAVNSGFSGLSAGAARALRGGSERMTRAGAELLGRLGYRAIGNDPVFSLDPGSPDSKYRYRFYAGLSMLGLGPGALSYAKGRAWHANSADPARWSKLLSGGVLPVERGCRAGRRREMISALVSLADSGYIPDAGFRKLAGTVPSAAFGGKLRCLEKRGVLLRRPRGWEVADQERSPYEIAREFFEPAVLASLLGDIPGRPL